MRLMITPACKAPGKDTWLFDRCPVIVSRPSEEETCITEDDHQRVIDELQAVIDDTQHTLERFEATGMATEMPEDYDTLLTILDDAVTRQRAHTLAMLDQA